MSAFDLISDFGFPVTITRYAAGSYVNGLYVDGSTTTLSAIMSIQPTNGLEDLLLPEGLRTKNLSKAYSSVELFVSNQITGRKADLVTDVSGITYEVQKLNRMESFNSDIAPHWKAILAQLNPQ